MRIAECGMRAAMATATAVLAAGGGCAATRYLNTSPRIERHFRASREPVFRTHFKAAVLYPARDILIGEPLWRRLFGDEAWNLVDDDVPDGSFWQLRTASEVTPEALAQGHGADLAPRQPFEIRRVKNHGGTGGFFGTDADGREYIVKMDDPRYPELGSTASIIATRIYHALGYHVPPIFLVTVEGTGDPRFDGRRGTASPLIPDVVGHFQFNWFRHRREMRALRMVAAWLNDTDRSPNNNLVAREDGAAKYYLIDFNGALGSWQGRPKEPWRGWRYAAGSGDALVRVLTLGLVRPAYDPKHPVVSPAVGRFNAGYDPMTWAPQVANTAFDQMTARDRNWIVNRIAALDRPQIEAVVASAGLSRRGDRDYLVETLLARKAKIMALSEPRASRSRLGRVPSPRSPSHDGLVRD